MDSKTIETIVREVLSRTDAGGRQGCRALDLTGDLPNPTGDRPDSTVAGLRRANGGLIRSDMTLEIACRLIRRIEEKAAEQDMRVVTAVSDAAGKPVAVHCMDGAYMGSFDVALNKTYTSIAFQMSTEQLGKLSQPGQSLYGIQFTNQGRIVIFGGGELLTKDGVIFGALGVSGGSARQDTDLAAYGKSIFEEVIACL